jgi:phosphate-selective porin OprO/OprP
VNTLRLRNRYEGLVTTGAGDQSHSIYGGLNYYIHGHRAKLMVGAEYLDMVDEAADGGEFDGWTLIGGAVLWF